MSLSDLCEAQQQARCVLVTGSRSWTDFDAIKSELKKCISAVRLIHGNAHGADLLAAKAADELKFKMISGYRAQWDKYGRAAGPIRNKQMLDEGKPDFVLAFHKDESRGTQHMINIARAANVPVKVIT